MCSFTPSLRASKLYLSCSLTYLSCSLTLAAVQLVSLLSPAAPNNDETATQRQERPEFAAGQMQTIQQLIADTVKQSAWEIATEAARAG